MAKIGNPLLLTAPTTPQTLLLLFFQVTGILRRDTHTGERNEPSKSLVFKHRCKSEMLVIDAYSPESSSARANSKVCSNPSQNAEMAVVLLLYQNDTVKETEGQSGGRWLQVRGISPGIAEGDLKREIFPPRRGLTQDRIFST